MLNRFNMELDFNNEKYFIIKKNSAYKFVVPTYNNIVITSIPEKYNKKDNTFTVQLHNLKQYSICS